MARSFSPGFRLSRTDLVVLWIGAIAAVGVGRIDLALGIVIAFTVGHFFLFCNVLRMARSRELIWAGVFLGLAAGTLTQGQPSWGVTFGVAFCVTVIISMVQLRHPSYHGIAWQYFNPNLPQWWEAKQHASDTHRASP
ncbi:MAG: hypothetical protein PHU06_11080 [Gallionella sp.]|nr:hypothetical protein [Gallionella sp.]MDD4959866.1 hypothetical protein [Gallionella sp.]